MHSHGSLECRVVNRTVQRRWREHNDKMGWNFFYDHGAPVEWGLAALAAKFCPAVHNGQQLVNVQLETRVFEGLCIPYSWRRAAKKWHYRVDRPNVIEVYDGYLYVNLGRRVAVCPAMPA
jgi:hypothetical protein